ncbi:MULTISPECIES: TapB family protein [Paraburkholderia]|uniref:DUF3108 domain-containing protein n=1 Tax=Paraburkholderia metrosideri TaxID=580937 RepID=A0ABW9E4A9_9BURK
MPLSTLAASAVVAASAALSASLPAPVPVPLTEAQAPTFVVGEEWEFAFTNVLEPAKSHNYKQKVITVPAGKVGLEVDDGRSAPATLDASANLTNSSGGSYEPSDQRLQFPLAVGKSWSTSYVYKFGAWVAHCDRTTKVVSVERIQTPAGSFDAFKIEQVTSWSGNDQYGGHGTTRETDWYAPTVGRIAKMDFQDIPVKGPATTTHVELLRYVPAPH